MDTPCPRFTSDMPTLLVNKENYMEHRNTETQTHTHTYRCLFTTCLFTTCVYTPVFVYQHTLPAVLRVNVVNVEVAI